MGSRRAGVSLVVLLALAAGCGGNDDSGGTDVTEPSSTELTDTEVAPDVTVSLELIRRGNEVDGLVTITNGRSDDIAVPDAAGAGVDPSTDDPDMLRLVQTRIVVEPGFTDATAPGDAPPTTPGLVVGAGRSLERELRVGTVDDWRTVELCVEVADVLDANVGTGGDRSHGDEVSIRGRDPDTPAAMACSGPVEMPSA